MHVRRTPFLILGMLVVTLVTLVTALVVLRQPTKGAQLFVSPYLEQRGLAPVDELYGIAFDHVKLMGLVGEPTGQQEYFLTQGQLMTLKGINMPESALPDRDIPVYVLRVTGEFNEISPTGAVPDMAEVAVLVNEKRLLGFGLKLSRDVYALDVNVQDISYPDAPPQEVMEAHQFKNTPMPDEDERDLLPLPEAPNE